MQAAHRRVAEFKSGLPSVLVPGKAMEELAVLAMNCRIHIVKTDRAAALERRAAARATRTQTPAGGNAGDMGSRGVKGDSGPDTAGDRHDSKRQRCSDGGKGKGKGYRDPRK
ncbi:unnamed protein product [Ectocarpus fasciculatus]